MFTLWRIMKKNKKQKQKQKQNQKKNPKKTKKQYFSFVDARRYIMLWVFISWT